MTETAPKPCPWCNPDFSGLLPRVNTANGIQHWVFCPECGMHGPCGIGETEAVSQWDSVCRPNPETQAVAQLEVRNGVASLKHLLVPIEQVSDGMMLYRSPVESVPAEKLRELEAEWLAECADKGIAQPIAAAIRKQCADRLSAIVKEYSK